MVELVPLNEVTKGVGMWHDLLNCLGGHLQSIWIPTELMCLGSSG